MKINGKTGKSYEFIVSFFSTDELYALASRDVNRLGHGYSDVRFALMGTPNKIPKALAKVAKDLLRRKVEMQTLHQIK